MFGLLDTCETSISLVEVIQIVLVEVILARIRHGRALVSNIDWLASTPLARAREAAQRRSCCAAADAGSCADRGRHNGPLR